MTTVFETIRVKDGRVPLLDRHLERFAKNCEATSLPLPADLRQTILAARRSDGKDHALRMEWDGTELRITPRDFVMPSPINIATAAEVHPGYTVKTTDRPFFDRARAEARAKGADEGLLLTPAGYVAEGSLFAIGWFEGDRLRIPSLDLGILPSIGRSRVIEVAKELGIEVEEGKFPRRALDGRPAFITTAVRGLVPIASLDGRPVPGDERIGRLGDRFWPE